MTVGTVLILWGGLTVLFCIAASLDHWLFERNLDHVQHAIRIRGGRWM